PVRLRIRLAEAARGGDDQGGGAAPENLVRGGDGPDPRYLDLLLVEWRRAEVRVDAAGAAHEGEHRVGMRESDGEGIEARVLVLAPCLGCRHLQDYRLRRHLDGGQRDLVLLAEVLDRLHGGVPGDEVEWVRRHR